MDDKIFDAELLKEFKDIANNCSTIFKYIDFDGGYELLSHSQLRITNPLYFNDPYDCYPGLISFNNPKSYISYIINKYFGHLERNERRKQIQRLSKDPKSLIDGFYEFVINDKDSRGIICFSRDPQNLLMWSQYANSHTGICIGFNLAKLYYYIKSSAYTEVTEKDEIVFLSVKYTEKLEACDYFTDGKKSIINWLRTKADCWKYEKEIRIVFSSIQFENEPFINIPFDKNIIDKIYLGSKIKEHEASKLINKLKENYPHVKIYKMELSKTNFDLIPNQKEISINMF